ncbi:MAG: hypothetical protein WCD18_09935 [Thermosynechococcaceae cyanobacterium]
MSPKRRRSVVKGQWRISPVQIAPVIAIVRTDCQKKGQLPSHWRMQQLATLNLFIIRSADQLGIVPDTIG